LEINSNIADPATYELGIYFGFGSTSEHILAIPLPTVALTTDAQLAAFIESLSTDDYTVSVELVATGDEFLPFYGIITVTTCALDCQIGDYQVQLAVNLIGDPPLPPYTNQFVQQTENATQLLATVTIPSAPDGCYVFGLYDDNYPYQSIFAFSNTLYLNNEDCFSSMWQFGSSEDAIIEGFEYYSGWMQQLRLPINGAGQKPKIEESIYRNSDGTYQRPSNYSDLTVDLHSDYLDLETRNAVFSATRCPILIFEDQSIFVSGDLDVATVQDFSNKTSYRKLAQMKFSALIQGFQPNNNACIGC
jgi:hypothetical protein